MSGCVKVVVTRHVKICNFIIGKLVKLKVKSNYGKILQLREKRKNKEEEIGKISRVRVHKFDEITILQDVQETNVPPRLQKRRKEAMS